MGICDFEKTETCPYDPNHQILPSRMHLHLIRCAKQHPNAKMEICPFHWCHHVPVELFHHHLTECEYREVAVKMKFTDESNDNQMEKTFTRERPITVEEENWDDGAVYKDFDPLAKARSKQVPIVPRGLTKSERRAYREGERLRLKSLKIGDIPEEGKSHNEENSSQEIEILPELRRPKQHQPTVERKASPDEKVASFPNPLFFGREEGACANVPILDDYAALASESSFSRGRLSTCKSYLDEDFEPDSPLTELDGLSIRAPSSYASSISQVTNWGRGRGRGQLKDAGNVKVGEKLTGDYLRRPVAVEIPIEEEMLTSSKGRGRGRRLPEEAVADASSLRRLGGEEKEKRELPGSFVPPKGRGRGKQI